MKKKFKEREKLHKYIGFWVGESAQWVALAAKPNNWNLVLGAHRLRRQNGPYKLASDFHVCYGMCVRTNTRAQTHTERKREPQTTPHKQQNNKIKCI